MIGFLHHQSTDDSVLVTMLVIKSIIFFILSCTLSSTRGEIDANDLIDKIATKIARVVVGEEDNLGGNHSDVVDRLLDRTVKEAGAEIKKLQELLLATDDAYKTRLQVDLLREITKKVRVLGQSGDDGKIAPRFLSFIANKIKALAGAVVGTGVGAMAGAIKGANWMTSECSDGSCPDYSEEE